MLRRVVWWKLKEVSEVITAFVALLKQEAPPETSVSLYQTTWRNIPEDKSYSYSPP
jgi:hypothetical protein